MRTIVFCSIVCCAGAFYACEQSSVGPIPPPSVIYAAADYMLNAKAGDSEVFKQTVYDSSWNMINPPSTLTMTVVGTNVPLDNGEKAVEVAYTLDGHPQPDETDYIASSDSGIVSYSDIDCKKSKNLLLNPLGEGKSFRITNDDYRVEDYIVIDSLNTTIKTSAGTFPALKLTECQVSTDQSSDHIKDSASVDIYLVAGYLEAYQVETDVQKLSADGQGNDIVLSKSITVTDLTSKTW
ncbi:MAG TPA: hypothetical protein VFA55_08635 [Candidatus Kapabacteria bacterium]|nr:hypothetical protein [Candidatus Kapabacteria bacterium]